MHLDLFLDFLLRFTILLGLLLSLSFRFCLFFGFLGCLILSLVAALVLVGCLSVNFSLLQVGAIVLNILICHVKVFFRILDLFVDFGQDELLWRAELVVDDVEALVESLDLGDDVLLADAKVVHLDVEIDLDLVDGALKKNHLLSLLS